MPKKKVVTQSNRKLRSMADTTAKEVLQIDESNMDAGQLEMTKYLKLLNDKLSRVETKLSKFEELENKVNDLEIKVDINTEETAFHKARVSELEVKYNSLLEKHLMLDAYIRKENLIFHGVTHSRNENCAEKIRQIMKVTMLIANADNIRFQRCHRLPGRGPNNPIICRFLSYQDRELVWGKKTSLKNSRVYITENFPPEIEERRQVLYPILREAKKQKMKCTIKYDQLIVEGEVYTIESLNKLPAALNPANIATVTKDGITCFFTGSSPLSNFHLIKDGITIDGNKYDCVERYFQMNRALFAEKPDIAQKIRQARGPLQCKILGDSIKLNEDAWLPEAKKAMVHACRSKFQQNGPCMKFLLATQKTELAEAGPNILWGIGLRKEHPDAFTKDKWLGQNLLGNILMTIRQEIVGSAR